MSRAFYLAAIWAIGFLVFPQSVASVTLEGQVFNTETGEPVSGANVVVRSAHEDLDLGVASGTDGRFQVRNLPIGTYVFSISHVGYEAKVIRETYRTNEMVRLRIDLIPALILADPIEVISVSRQTERILSAPAGVQIVDASQIQAKPALSPARHLAGLTGVDFVQTGINQSRVVVRGFNDPISDRLMVLTDHRTTRVPSLRVNLYQLIPTVDHDIERIEVISGPGAALSVPNAAGGVMHVVTRSPIGSEGVTVGVEAGERGLSGASFRAAGSHEGRWGYRVTGRVYRATDWKSFDPAEPDSVVPGYISADGRVDEGPAVPNTRDCSVRAGNVNVRLDARPTPETEAVLNAGFSRASNLEYTGIGAIQFQGATFAHAMLRAKGLFVQTFLNKLIDGTSINMRTGDRLTNRSSLLAVQAQHTLSFGEDRHRLIYGSDLLLTRPDTRRTINGRNEDFDNIDEYGFYVQGETEILSGFRLTGAVRVDDHSRLGKTVVSPRGAAVFTWDEKHAIRFTANRAFTTPTSDELFADIS
jgi:outer membrane receptor for ferrienterochelin and colicin